MRKGGECGRKEDRECVGVGGKKGRERVGGSKRESESWLNTVRTIIVCTTNCEIYDNEQRREEQDVRTVRRAEIRAANEGKKGRGRGRSSGSRQPLMDVL